MWLHQYLENYNALRLGTPLRHLRAHDPATAAVPHWRTCAYCNSGKACTHEAPRTVPAGTATKAPLVSWHDQDPMIGRQIAADIDRCIDALPGQARDLFHLRYRVGLPLTEVAHRLRIRSMADVARCHDYHLASMAETLKDWAPSERRSA